MALKLKGEEKYYDNEHRVLTKTGEWLWVRSRGEVVERDEKGSAVRHTGTFHIIDDRKKPS